MDFKALVESNTRTTDNYVNVTKWCTAFGKRWDTFTRVKDHKAYLESLTLNASVNGRLVETNRGKRSGTWVHPLVALRVAQWLSPEFHVCVNQVFQRYLEGDVTLATEIVKRSKDSKAVEKHLRETEAHAKYLKRYHDLFDELKDRDCKTGHYITTNIALNKAVGIEKRADMNESEAELMAGLELISNYQLKRKPEAMKSEAVKVVKDTITGVINSLN